MHETYDIFNTGTAPCAQFTSNQQATIQEAIGILESRLRTTKAFTSPSDVKQFCQLQIVQEKDEHFCCMFMDSQHRLIAFERLFSGTIDGASVHPRVVVRRALELNAAAVIFTHNHPSGVTTPSQSDIAITKRLKQALGIVDVRVLDHMVVGTEGAVSMAERGTPAPGLHSHWKSKWNGAWLRRSG